MSAQPDTTHDDYAAEIRAFFRFFWMDWLANPERRHALEEASGLPRSAQVILQRLYAQGPMTTTTLGKGLMLDRSTISRQLRPLKDLGLLHTETDRSGRRSKLSLTDDGRRLARDIDALVMSGYNDAVTRMHPERQKALAELLSELRDAMVATVSIESGATGGHPAIL